MKKKMIELGNDKTMKSALIIEYPRKYWAVVYDARTGEDIKKMTFPKAKGEKAVTAIVRNVVRAAG